MFGRIQRLDWKSGFGFVDSGKRDIGIVPFRLQDNQGFAIGQTVSFDIAVEVADQLFATNVRVRDERNKSKFNTEDKQKWYREGEKLERQFLARFKETLPSSLAINPEKQSDPTAIDLLDSATKQYADLKTQNTPFFTAQKIDPHLDPRYTVTFNRKDYSRYKSRYPECDIYFWVDWKQTKLWSLRIEPLEGVWMARFGDMQNAIDSKSVKLHKYKYRSNDESNAKDSYLFDLRSPIFSRLA